MSSNYNPIQVFKHCPRCGEKGLLSDTNKSLLCKSCGFRYFINMSASVAAIIRNDNNEVLFTIRKYEPAAGLLDLPGGFVDLGENAEDAVKREIFEELNLEITEMKYLGTFTNTYLYSEVEYQTLDLVFNCTVKSFSTLRVADDVSGYVFKDPGTVQSEEIGLKSIVKIISSIAS